ncbi:carbohydrate sulfotransferase 11 isoform X2 [Octopus bimaculoides]|uniref:carbohydrate sulfotransferase 11 isoform X2 n=1 Tax=Octopus bimaculoides TaxID=37653 RepID=UPI00071E059E|nr:carbohydrate sulfotransferase 11 isoform X2 [Octopus bimaculoides]|eukprot:XP_014786520.1 PREDICTED: carbohydrate sulfotransferase 11-like isoform X2 [Octopus bimaculoides]
MFTKFIRNKKIILIGLATYVFAALYLSEKIFVIFRRPSVEVVRQNIAGRQRELKENIYAVCQNDTSKYYGYTNKFIFHSHIYVNTRREFIHCLIEKVGCSFFKRLLYFFSNNKHSLKDPFEITLGDAHGLPNERFSQMSVRQIENILKNYKKIIFVREPYSRLLSAYVDKLFVRSSRWQLVLRKISNANNRPRRKCYNNVTFAEFVTYFVKTITNGLNTDGHFMPMYTHCKPCLIKYDFIGKLESFQNDAEKMMAFIGLSDHKYLIQKAKNASVLDELTDAAHILFSSDSNLKNPCYDPYNAAQKTWRKLQMKGLISIHINFPYSPQNWLNITKQEFLTSLMQKHQHSVNTDTNLSENRKMVLREAYQDIPDETKLKLKEIFEPDCLLFKYNPFPSFVFDKAPLKSSFRFFSTP